MASARSVTHPVLPAHVWEACQTHMSVHQRHRPKVLLYEWLADNNARFFVCLVRHEITAQQEMQQLHQLLTVRLSDAEMRSMDTPHMTYLVRDVLRLPQFPLDVTQTLDAWSRFSGQAQHIGDRRPCCITCDKLILLVDEDPQAAAEQQADTSKPVAARPVPSGVCVRAAFQIKQAWPPVIRNVIKGLPIVYQALTRAPVMVAHRYDLVRVAGKAQWRGPVPITVADFAAKTRDIQTMARSGGAFIRQAIEDRTVDRSFCRGAIAADGTLTVDKCTWHGFITITAADNPQDIRGTFRFTTRQGIPESTGALAAPALPAPAPAALAWASASASRNRVSAAAPPGAPVPVYVPQPVPRQLGTTAASSSSAPRVPAVGLASAFSSRNGASAAGLPVYVPQPVPTYMPYGRAASNSRILSAAVQWTSPSLGRSSSPPPRPIDLLAQAAEQRWLRSPRPSPRLPDTPPPPEVLDAAAALASMRVHAAQSQRAQNGSTNSGRSSKKRSASSSPPAASARRIAIRRIGPGT